ncbi:trans-1,2-dihydrobenzene-1,2-diol dehydrogenase [Halyomorpha halys]|uniref:trans-1,2-dihydrobenzene-1,2-diol dehydrogenase n=1 Tax=Halyomorpha halys TaxID=286706 RepID=UPI0006D4F3B1|nr:trans-1,2-dihydrobenzene-1,2-diol dehydrogenase-like [Halyomorpha halys]
MALRWGIMGTSKSCNDFANSLNYLPRSEHLIMGVASGRKEEAIEFARKHNIPNAFENYGDLAKDKSIDVVYIGSSNKSHFILARLVLYNKKHLLCEPPLCIKYKDTEELLALAKKNKLFFMEGVWSRFFPAYNELSQLLASETIGDVIYLNADLGVPTSCIDKINHKELEEGTVFDYGVYVLQLALLIFGRNPLTLSAEGDLNENGMDENIIYILKYENGKRAILCTHSQIKMDNSAVVYGSKGHIKLKDPFWAPTVISMNNGPETRFPLPAVENEKYFMNSQGLVYEAIEVRDCIMKGLLESPKMTHEDTLTIAKWQECICKSTGSQAIFQLED